MTFGVGVEGPSDFQFWHKVLHKYFRGCRFDVRNMKNRDKLIRETPKLLETFRDCHYAAGFILVDLDDDPCLSSVLDLFDSAIRQAARRSDKRDRFLHVCMAIKELESWYLADADAINAVIPGCEWNAPADTGTVAKGKVQGLVKTHLGRNASFNEIDFAKSMGPKFNPGRARPHSASFRYFWELLESKARPNSV
ncbi:MAG TPA: DUF4276 family protein [Candidatus Angelobacter sp.]|nr:DUF4276 family protein [Candidatus Angelobacter sp.]